MDLNKVIQSVWEGNQCKNIYIQCKIRSLLVGFKGIKEISFHELNEVHELHDQDSIKPPRQRDGPAVI